MTIFSTFQSLLLFLKGISDHIHTGLVLYIYTNFIADFFNVLVITLFKKNIISFSYPVQCCTYVYRSVVISSPGISERNQMIKRDCNQDPIEIERHRDKMVGL